ncbi:MAG: site-specific DNA-methyltransferase [Parcubacteria group bacterium]|nr:site-specific DNA-methyltransferase [Parcubacteria group bacterium]
MKKLSKLQLEQINELLRKGQALPEEYKNLLFESKKEYELVYGGKEREEDIIAETMAVPLQPVKTLGKDGHENGWVNKLIFGDNLQVLKTLYNDPEVKGKVKLIYIDPPFATKQEFRGSKEQKAYQDKLIGAQFLEFLRKRLILLREILADDGSIYVHLDWRKGPYVRVLMDEVFGEQNFRNEIVWKKYSGVKNQASKKLTTQTDSIFWYSKTDNIVFNQQYRPMSEEYIEGEYKYTDKDGRKYALIRGRGYKDEKKTTKKYLDENPGSPITSLWDDDGLQLNTSSAERINYPTQKPESLLERIVKISSNEDDIVLDVFAGAGTTLSVAEKLNRRWIGVDCGKLSIYTTQKRMLNLKAEIGNKGKAITPKPFTVYNAGLYDYKLIKELPWNEYRDFALKLFQCRDEEHKVSGVKLNGYLGEDHVLVFQWHDGGEIILDRGFIDDLHKTLGKKVGQKFFIIAPASTVVFLEDYIEKDNTKYYLLRIPYSIIEEIHEHGFEAIKQPVSEADVNDVVDAVGFDFIQTPDVECEYKIRKADKKTLFDGDKEAVIKIKKFKSNVLSRKPIEFKNLETLSMVMVDYNFNGEVFDIDQYWFAESLEKDGFEIRFDPKKVEKQMMIIYMDIFGNEKREVKTLKDFK